MKKDPKVARLTRRVAAVVKTCDATSALKLPNGSTASQYRRRAIQELFKEVVGRYPGQAELEEMESYERP